MLPMMPTTTTDELATTLARAKSRREPAELHRLTPTSMTIRKSVMSLRGLFTRSQETDSAVLDSTPAQPITSIAPRERDEDAPRIAA